MPRKKFEDKPYRPIQAESLRGLTQLDADVEYASDGNAAVAIADRPPATAVSPPTQVPKVDTVVRAQPEPVGEGGSRRIDTAPGIEPAASDMHSDVAEKSVSIRFELRPDEKDEFDDFIKRLKRRSRSSIGLSSALRSLMMIAQQAEDQINDEIEKARPFARPSNRDVRARAELEEKWLQVFSAALRKMTPIR